MFKKYKNKIRSEKHTNKIRLAKHTNKIMFKKYTNKKLTLIIFSIIILTLLTSLVFAEQILRVELVLSKDNQVVLKNIKGMFGNSDESDLLKQDYSIRITNNNNNNNSNLFHSYTPIQFKIYTDPPTSTNDVLITKRLPYFGNQGKLEFVHKNKTIFEFDLKNLCNNDQVCNNFENHITCESDCALDNFDGACNNELDGVCDPDCAPRVDSDCIEKEVKKSFVNKYNSILIILLIVSFLILASGLWFYARKYSKSFKRKR